MKRKGLGDENALFRYVVYILVLLVMKKLQISRHLHQSETQIKCPKP